jgi:AsmA protein
MRAIKITALTGVIVVALAALAVVFGVPAGFLTGAIQKQVKAATGYRMMINGGAKLALRPSLSLSLRDVALIDDSDRTAQPRLTAASVRIDTSLSSLWSGRPHVTEIAVLRPTLFVPLTREPAAPPARAAAGAGGGSSQSADVTIDRIVVEGGTVVFTSARDAIDGRLQHIELTATLSKPGDALELRATARAGEQTIGARVTGKVPGLRLDGQTIPIEFAIEAPGLLQDAAPGVAELKVQGSSIAITGLQGSIGENKFSGWLTVELSAKPKVRTALEFQRLYVAVAQNSSPSASVDPPAGLDRPWRDTRINLVALNVFDAEAQFSATELRVDRYRFAPISAVAILADGLLRGAVTRTGGYGGQIQGTLSIDASAAEPSHALRLDVIGVQALPFLSDVASFPHLDGRMVARIDARGRGNSERAIMASLGGAIDLRFQDGAIRGVNIAEMIRTLGGSIINGWNESGAKRTDMSELTALFRIERGQATTDNLRLMGPLVRVSGSGTADIAAKTLQFRLDPKLVASLEGQGGAANPVGLGVPVVVQGSWSAPRIYPEIAGILDNPEQAFGKLKELGSGLLGNQSGSAGSLIQGLGGVLGGGGGRPTSPSQQGAQTPSQNPQPRTEDTQNQLRDVMREMFRR